MGLKIRGIYATALTRLFLDHGYCIVEPSRPIRARFKGCDNIDVPVPIKVDIRDRKDGQGIIVSGEPAELEQVTMLLRKNLFDAVCRVKEEGPDRVVEVELPYQAKKALDGLRNRVLPTVNLHHRLRLIAPKLLDLMEKKQLARRPGHKKGISKDLEKNLIWGFLKRGREVAIEHCKLDGRVLSLSEGIIINSNYKEKRLLLKRSRFKGRYQYDGLSVPKEEGDYAVTEVKEGSWYYRHSYYRRDGRLIGQYYNINTPVELYPDRIRYVDLEVDVVKWPQGRSEVVEKELLDRQVKNGSINRKLGEKALAIAEELNNKLFEQQPW